ncbi:hypothetical protein, partial [Stenotrophomonas maltophilia]|uniref:hypothetical protein n=1 Tax=Stenotrophomonas maltophilia TaxID=40324 RepID=UPI00313E7880
KYDLQDLTTQEARINKKPITIKIQIELTNQQNQKKTQQIYKKTNKNVQFHEPNQKQGGTQSRINQIKKQH